MSKLKIKLSGSFIGASPKQKGTLKALGFKKSQTVVEKDDTPVIRGMINKVNHLLTVEEA